MPNRRALLAALAAATAAGVAPAAGAVTLQPIMSAGTRGGTALVLSGGGAAGAYEAGVIEGLVRGAGVTDGQALPGIDTVVGTSIGAINGWFVATAQYTTLRTAWQTIASSDIFRPKRAYAKLEMPSAGVATRLTEGLSLLGNLNRSMGGIFDPGPIKAWLRAHVDPQRPIVVPFVFNAADIRNLRAAYFYAIDSAVEPASEIHVRSALTSISGLPVRTHDAKPILHDALYASIALPLLLDPIELVIDGTPGLFVDGGSADNTAIDVARVVARRINAVFVDPATTTYAPTNAIGAGLGSFNLLQRRVLDASLRAAYEATTLKRVFAGATLDADQRAYLDGVYDVDLGVLRPAIELPTQTGDFHDPAKLGAAYALGLADAARGWTPYTPPA